MRVEIAPWHRSCGQVSSKGNIWTCFFLFPSNNGSIDTNPADPDPPWANVSMGEWATVFAATVDKNLVLAQQTGMGGRF